jgi:hypothetical protein
LLPFTATAFVGQYSLSGCIQEDAACQPKFEALNRDVAPQYKARGRSILNETPKTLRRARDWSVGRIDDNPRLSTARKLTLKDYTGFRRLVSNSPKSFGGTNRGNAGLFHVCSLLCTTFGPAMRRPPQVPGPTRAAGSKKGAPPDPRGGSAIPNRQGAVSTISEDAPSGAAGLRLPTGDSEAL